MRQWRPGVTSPSTSILLVLLEQKSHTAPPSPVALQSLTRFCKCSSLLSSRELPFASGENWRRVMYIGFFWSFVWSLCDITPLKSLFHNIMLASLGKAAGEGRTSPALFLILRSPREQALWEEAGKKVKLIHGCPLLKKNRARRGNGYKWASSVLRPDLSCLSCSI